MKTISSIRFPSIAHVAHDLRLINAEQIEESDNEDEQGIDVRLRVYDGGWQILSGLSDYDQDHRGFWGCSSVPGNGKRFRSEEIARDLIEQARDHHAQSLPISEVK